MWQESTENRERAGYSGAMSMERMFEDLEARLEHLEGEEIRANAEELGRAERAQLTLLDRLRGSLGRRVRVHLRAGGIVEGSIAEVSDAWIVLGDAEGRVRAIVARAAVAGIEGLAARSRPQEGARPGRSFASLLRALARDRDLVRVTCEGIEVTGRFSGIGSDSADLAVLPTGERSALGGGTITLALDAVSVVRVL